MRDALRSSHADEKRHHEGIIAGLQKRYDHLRQRIDAMYVDNLDGRITTAYLEDKGWGVAPGARGHTPKDRGSRTSKPGLHGGRHSTARTG